MANHSDSIDADYREIQDTGRSYTDIVRHDQQIPYDMGNPDPRIPAILLVDTSGSMSGDRIAQVNRMIERLHTALLRDRLASVRVELAVVAFGERHRVVQDFALPKDWTGEALTTGGGTAMGAAINTSLDLLEARKKLYKTQGTEYYRPWLILLTDGGATDDMAVATERVKAYQSKKKVVWVPLVIGNSPDAFRTLMGMSNYALPFEEDKWDALLAYLLEQFRSVSQSAPEDNVGPGNASGVASKSLFDSMMGDFMAS